MARITGPNCAVMRNSIDTHAFTHTHTWEDQCEWHRMARMTGPGLRGNVQFNKYTHTVTRSNNIGHHDKKGQTRVPNAIDFVGILFLL